MAKRNKCSRCELFQKRNEKLSTERDYYERELAIQREVLSESRTILRLLITKRVI